LRAIAKIERRGKRLTDTQAESIARQIAEAGTPGAPRQGQGSSQGEPPLLGEQSEIDDYVVRRMRKGQGTHASTGSGRQDDLGGGDGQRIAPEEEAAVLTRHFEPEQLYKTEVNKPGRLNSIRVKAAQRLSRGQESRLKIKGEAYFQIRRELQKQLEQRRNWQRLQK
jgi:hypothetical protein